MTSRRLEVGRPVVLPSVTIVIPYEGTPRVSLVAAGHADELALRAWLRRRPRALASLADLSGLLEELDRADAGRRAA